MNGRWVEFRDGRQHFVAGQGGKGYQPAYAACGHVEVMSGEARAGPRINWWSPAAARDKGGLARMTLLGLEGKA